MALSFSTHLSILTQWFHKWGSPKFFYGYARKVLPWSWACFAVLFTYGLIGGLFIAPADYQQGEGFRMIYVHVPCAFLSLLVYSTMALAALVGLVWRMKLAFAYVRVAAPLGAMFTFLALVTGALWGKPMWGTWWIWDARLTSELILLFLYLGLMALHNGITNGQTADRACGFMVLLGALNLPVIHYSVKWWNTLHQGTTVSLFSSQSHMAPSMLYPLLAMIGAFGFYFVAVVLMRLRAHLLETEQHSLWLKEALQ